MSEVLPLPPESGPLRQGPAPCLRWRGFQFLGCPFRNLQGGCLDRAAVQGWPAFTCAGCVHAVGVDLQDQAVFVVGWVLGERGGPTQVRRCPECGSDWSDGRPCPCHHLPHPKLRELLGALALGNLKKKAPRPAASPRPAALPSGEPRLCQAPGCPRLARARHLCPRHYKLRAYWRNRRTCRQCGARHYREGWCAVCYRRFVRQGETLPVCSPPEEIHP